VRSSAPRAAETRGVLYPARLPSLRRVPAPPEVAELVRWFWIPEWDIAPGRTSRQYLVSYPACNLVVQPLEVTVAGPTTRVSYRDLTGRGWAVGALLRPAAVPTFAPDPGRLRDREKIIEAQDLHAAVVAAMAIEDQEKRHAAAVETFSAWLARRVPPLTDRDRLANRMAEIIDADPDVQSVADAADRLGVSPRTLQRLTGQYVGLTPAEMIRRRRLQEAAQRVRTDPSASLAEIAAELGYADQAHLTHEFRQRLGFTPATYRGQVRQAPSETVGDPTTGGQPDAERSLGSATRRSRDGGAAPALARI
jgi:AraC-type DNA-binding domain-containing proteins